MNREHLELLAEQLLAGHLDLPKFLQQVTEPPTADLNEAQIDLDRRRRCGYPEVVYGQGKTTVTLEKIFRTLLSSGTEVLATRISAEQAAELAVHFPNGRYNVAGRTLRIPLDSKNEPVKSVGHVVIVTAGTSDLPVAEETRETLLWMGVSVTMIFDVGVAGPHRLREHLHQFEGADAVVVIAGMEGICRASWVVMWLVP